MIGSADQLNKIATNNCLFKFFLTIIFEVKDMNVLSIKQFNYSLSILFFRRFLMSFKSKRILNNKYVQYLQKDYGRMVEKPTKAYFCHNYGDKQLKSFFRFPSHLFSLTPGWVLRIQVQSC